PIRQFEVDAVLNRVYVTTDASGTTPGRLHILDGSTNGELATFDVYSSSNAAVTQSGLRVDEARGLVYVSDFVKNAVTIIDGTATTVKASLPVCNGPGAIGINKAANRAYVACANAFALTFIDGNGPGGSYRVVGHLPLPFQPSFLNVDDAASLIYVTSGSSPTPRLTIVPDMNGALAGLLTAPTAS